MSIPEASTPSLLWRSLRSSKSFSRYSVSSILPTIFLITPRMYMPCLQHRVHLVNLSPLSRFKGRPSVSVDWSAFEHKIQNKAMVFLGNAALHFTITFCLMWIVGRGNLHIFSLCCLCQDQKMNERSDISYYRFYMYILVYIYTNPWFALCWQKAIFLKIFPKLGLSSFLAHTCSSPRWPSIQTPECWASEADFFN